MRTVSKAIAGMAAAAALAAVAAPASAATVINASWGDGCSKSTCFNQQGVYTYSWSGGSGPVSVGQLTLDRSILGAFDGKMFRLSFQIGGEEIGSWGKFLMAGIGGDTLTFGGQEFTWNPEDGDLVLVLELIPPPKPGAASGFTAFAQSDDPGDTGDGDGPPPFQLADGPTTNQEGGDVAPRGAVPEPGAWALMITGFGAAGTVLRRRRTALA